MYLRFTVRDVLWLTAVAALVVAWSTDHWRQVQRIAELEVYCEALKPLSPDDFGPPYSQILKIPKPREGR